MTWVKSTGGSGHVLVICAREDSDRVAEFCDKLEADGIRCWYLWRYSFGQESSELAMKAFEGVHAVLVYYTPAFENSQIARMQLSYAVDRGCKIFLYMADGDGLQSEESKYFLGTIQAAGPETPREVIRKALAPYSVKEAPAESFDVREAQPQAKTAPRKKKGLLARLFNRGGGGGSPASKTPTSTSSPTDSNTKPKSKVDFSVISPKAVQPDSYGIISLLMYLHENASFVEEFMNEVGGAVKETSKKGFHVERDAVITARLESPHAEIADDSETRTWEGDNLNFDFQFHLPAGFDRGSAAFTCHVECNGIPITRLNFLVAVAKASEPDTVPASVTRDDYKKAFVSYSRKDEQRMLSRVLSIQTLAPDMSFWLDKQSMDAGAVWRDEVRRAIRISDMLLLFWSVAASKSKEVEAEWEYAYEERGLSFITPVPLDPPDQCPPPEKLSALNFNVRAFGRNEITEQLSFYDSNSRRL